MRKNRCLYENSALVRVAKNIGQHAQYYSLTIKTAKKRIERSQRDGKISAIFLDWHFRGNENGRQLLEFCREHNFKIPIILVTADADVYKKISEYDNEVIGLFNKPLTKNKWKAIKRLLRVHAGMDV